MAAQMLVMTTMSATTTVELFTLTSVEVLDGAFRLRAKPPGMLSVSGRSGQAAASAVTSLLMGYPPWLRA